VSFAKSPIRSAGVPPDGAWLWRLKTPAAEGYPPRIIEIIAELATSQILPMFASMFGREFHGSF
jgi:hypothetical protein